MTRVSTGIRIIEPDEEQELMRVMKVKNAMCQQLQLDAFGHVFPIGPDHIRKAPRVRPGGDGANILMYLP